MSALTIDTPSGDYRWRFPKSSGLPSSGTETLGVIDSAYVVHCGGTNNIASTLLLGANSGAHGI